MFNEKGHKLRLRRASQRFVEGNDFLMRLATDDILERLSLVNQSFTDAAVLFGRSDYACDALKKSAKAQNVTRVEDEESLGRTDHCATPTLLGFEDNSFDLIIAPLSLHWSNDLPGSLIQINRALRSNGLFLGSLPGPDTLFELRQSLLAAESEVSAGAANRVDSFTDIRDAGALLQRAGFALPVVDQESVTVRYDHPVKLINDLRGFGATAHSSRMQNPPLNRTILAAMAAYYHEHFADDDGRLRATFSFVSLSGWNPHESQQKPLKPGSAKARLADALKTEEKKLKD